MYDLINGFITVDKTIYYTGVPAKERTKYGYTMSVSNMMQTPAGKIGAGVIVVVAIGVLAFEIKNFASADGSRSVPPKQVISEAQQQIDAINKMTNISPEQKKALIAHEQGEIDIANGSTGAPKGKAGPPPASSN